MAQLKATRNILYLNRLYDVGEPLPTNDGQMIQAWVDAGSAIWVGNETAEVKEKASAEPAPIVKKAAPKKGKTKK